MKRNIIYTAACLVAFASCQKQEVAEAPSQVEVAVELTASAAADATKTVMTEYNAHWWSVSDKISLFYTVEGKTGHSVFTSKNYIPAASAKFAGSLSLPAEDTDLTTVSALAVYPATTADASDGTSVNVTVPSVQTAVEGSFMEGAYPVVAKTSDLTAALSFKAVCGGVKVSFQTPGITSFTFDAKGAKIAGTASVKIGEDGTPVATLGEDAVSKITVNAPAGGFEVGENLVWTPGLHSQTSADGEKYGAEVTTGSPAGYGEGSFSASVFKYTFVIDRKVVGLADATKTVVGVNFDNGKGIVGANLTNPDRGGYRLNLKSADSPAFDETAIYRKLRGVNDWANVDYTPITNPGNNRGNTKIKFDSDADYVYGYIEVPDTDNLYFKNGEYYEFCPGFISKLAIGLDLDGVESGQGIGWPVGTCWETVLNGRIISCKRPLSDEDKALGWKDRWGHYIFPSDSFDPETKTRPAYTITPETWSPSITEGKNGGFGDVKAGTSDWQNFATGKGEWKDKTFRYSFIIERERLGLKGLTELKLGIFMYEDGVSGYSNTPDAVGSTIKLNN